MGIEKSIAESQRYQNIILLIEVFHQLQVPQRLLHKPYIFCGMKQWSVDECTIAEDSADQAFEDHQH